MKNPNFWSKDDPAKANPTNSRTDKKTLITKYLQNPFSITWFNIGIFSQWMTKMQVQEELGDGDMNGEISQGEEVGNELNHGDESINWMDSVDPSLYYVIFSCQRWY